MPPPRRGCRATCLTSLCDERSLRSAQSLTLRGSKGSCLPLGNPPAAARASFPLRLANPSHWRQGARSPRFSKSSRWQRGVSFLWLWQILRKQRVVSFPGFGKSSASSEWSRSSGFSNPPLAARDSFLWLWQFSAGSERFVPLALANPSAGGEGLVLLALAILRWRRGASFPLALAILPLAAMASFLCLWQSSREGSLL
jgi:hypothetical protein